MKSSKVKQNSVNVQENVIDSPTRAKRINDYLNNLSEQEPIPKKNTNERKDDVIDSLDKKSVDCNVEETTNTNEECKQNEIDQGINNIGSIEQNTIVLCTTPAKHGTLGNPYIMNKKNIASPGKVNDDSFSMASVPEVVNLAKDGNIVSPFSLSDQKQSVVHKNMGINVMSSPSNVMSSPSAASLGINLLPKRPNYYHVSTARIRCAYINGDESQSVVFFFEELTHNSYYGQTLFLSNLKKILWLQQFLPWEIPGINSDVYKLFVNNKFVQGKVAGHGYTLFIYTHGVPVQDREIIKANAYRFCAVVQKIVKVKQNIIVDDDNFFLHNGPCVWSSIINETACVQRLTIEANDMALNDSLKVRNPKFWDKHEKLIRKYYNPNMLTVDLALKFNAPLDEIDERIILTQALIEEIGRRRLLINTWQDVEQDVLPSNVDPTSQVNYNITPNELNVNNDHPTHDELEDFVNNLGDFY